MPKQVIRIAAMAALLLTAIAGCEKNYREWQEEFASIRKNLSAVEDKLTAIPAKTELAPQPYIRGKIVLFKKDKGGKYELAAYQQLNEIYATKPDEVGTVALLDCVKIEKGVYKTSDGKEYPATVEDCALTIIDRAKAAVVFKKMFEKTPDATYKVSKSGSIYTQTALWDITDFLKGLPRT